MKQTTVMTNTLFSVLNTVVAILAPLVTAPYVTRVFGAAILGEVSYYTSLANWLLVFVQFGIPVVGARIIASNRTFSSALVVNLFAINVILSVGCFLLLVPISFWNVAKVTNKTLFLLAGTLLLTGPLLLDWLVAGTEQFRYVALRNICVRVLNVILIFALIHHETDTYIYLYIQLVSGLLIGLVNLYTFRVYFSFRQIQPKKMLELAAESIPFFIATLIGSFYLSLDTVLVGVLSQRDNVAYYMRARQVVLISSSIVAAFISVLSARIVNILGRDTQVSEDSKSEKAKKFLEGVASPLLFIVFGLFVATLTASGEIMDFFGGTDFRRESITLALLSLSIPATGLSICLMFLVAIPHNKERLNVLSVSVVAVVFLVVDVTLLVVADYKIASISFPLAEWCGFIVFATLLKKDIPKAVARKFLRYCGLSLATILVSLLLFFPIFPRISNYSIYAIIATGVLYIAVSLTVDTRLRQMLSKGIRGRKVDLFNIS